MAAKNLRRRKSQNRSIELLEDRRVMAAGTVGSVVPLGEPFVSNMPMIEHHGGFAEEPPQLVHHADPDADFWIERDGERDVETLLGDIEQTLASAHGLTGLTQVRNNYGFLGAGQTVAIIDSGIAFDHWALGNGYGANFRVVGGWDFAENDANPYDDGPEGSHGTHVAGIVGADRTGTIDDGVAPGVDLVGLRVFDDVGNGYFDWVEYALQWVHQNRNAHEYPITAVNLSIGSTWNDTSVPSWSTLEDEFAQLKADGIFVSVSAGNSFANYNTPGLSYPAASPNVVPVMSVDDNGSLSHFSQRHPSALAAPGRFIVSTVPDYSGNHNGVTDDFASFSGTSMAAPYVAGASVILREAMQFLGYANITQTTLFNHFMTTADTFFDSATGLNYKRLNLNSAINALMPTDDYGSTAGTAYNLGNLSGSSEISGLIGTLTDADYFRFTAAANGSVSFTASTTHGLAPVWTGSGGVVSGPQGNTFTFQVVAGQSYTFGLSTNGGIGYYDLAVQAQSSFTYVDWGTISQSQINNVANSSEKWYRVQASRNGFLTAEAAFATAGGNVDVSWHNSSLQMLATGVPNASGERVDVQATAGSYYYLRVVGTNADVDFRLTNLVSQSGNAVSVAGTSTDDFFTFTNGATQHVIGVNGANYNFAQAAAATITFEGSTGADAITLTGSTGNDTATLQVGSSTLAGSGYAVSASGIESVTIYGGGGSDTAYFYDSAGNDSFEGYSNRAILNGSGFSHAVWNFARAYATASQGNDRAYFYDSSGDDVYGGWSNRALMYGNGYRNEAWSFDNTYAYATSGNDKAYFYDSSGDDIYGGWSNRAVMYGTGFFNDTRGFDSTNAYSISGNDKAYFYDSTGDDTYGGWSDRAVMYGTGYFNDARGFDSTYAYATSGNDKAYFYDSTGDDKYGGWSNRALMYGTGYWNEASSFDLTYAYATSGNDKAYFYDSSGDDTYGGWSNRALMYGTGYWNEASSFDLTYAYATSGYDKAYFYDSAGDDTYGGWSNRALMYGTGYWNEALSFDITYAYATIGNDKAYFYDSAGDDNYGGWSDRAVMYGNGYFNDARGFDSTFAYATAGGQDRAYLYDSAGDDTIAASALTAYLSGGSFRNEVQGFENVSAYLINGGNDTTLISEVDFVFELFGDGN